MKYFTPCWFENGCLPVPEYEERFKAICKMLPDAIDEFFSLHDARIIRIQHIEKGYAQDDIVLFLDTKHSYTKSRRIVFTDAKLRIEGAIENTWWIAEEINVTEEGYRMDVMTIHGEAGKYSFLTIEFKDMLINS